MKRKINDPKIAKILDDKSLPGWEKARQVGIILKNRKTTQTKLGDKS